MYNYLKAIRVHHWAKNVLIFLPAFMGHQLVDVQIFKNACIAFLAFSFAASAGYLFNDILDLQADQNTPYKSKRPLASGEVSKKTYFSLTLLLIVFASFLSSLISTKFALVILLYFALSLAYSFYIKSVLALDVLVLAGFYAFRVFAGSVATDVPVSEWLLSFCLFFFLSLALAKRSSELINMTEENTNSRRAYRKSDLNVISQLGVCSGLVSVLVLAFYVTSEHVSILYTKPGMLWGLCVVLVYWISRFWIYVSQGKVEEDPVVFALKDKASYLSAVLILLIILFSL